MSKTSGRLNQHAKSEVAICPRPLDNTNTTGLYFGFQKTPRLKFIGAVGAMAAGETISFRLQQATDQDGITTKEVSVAEDAAFNSTTTITANTNVGQVTLTCVTVLATHAIVLNGVTLTAVAADPGAYEFDQRGNDNADAADLARAINAWVPGLFARNVANAVIVEPRDPSGLPITVEQTVGATITCATTHAHCIIEVAESDLDRAGGFNYVALRAVTTDTLAGICGTLERIPNTLPATMPVSAIVDGS